MFCGYRMTPSLHLQFEKAVTPPKPQPKAVTVPLAPHLTAAERSEHYDKDVAPARRARMSLAERTKLVSARIPWVGNASL